MNLKDSGIEWISHIPSDWEVKKLKYLAEIIDGDRGSEYPNDKDLVDDGILFLSGDNLKSNGFDYNKVRFISAEKFSKLGRGKVLKNDIITSVRGTIGSAGLFSGDVYEQAFINAQMMIIRPGKMLDSKFLFYFTKTKAWKLCLDYFAYGTAQQQLSNKILMQLPIAIPSLKIQHQVVKYLDEKINTVDKLIEKKEQLLSMLEQQRQSIITEAVTKGLNPNVKMKDSGVEWIGKIPEHWNLKKIKYTSYVKGRIGWQGLKAEEFQDEGPYLVTGTDFKNGTVDWDKCYRISEERYNQAPEIQLKEGDLLITKDGTIGKLALIKNLPGPTSLNSHLLVIRPLKNEFINEYLYWYFKSKVFLEYVEHTKTGTTFYGISQDSIEKFIFACPDIKEQEEINLYLKNNVQQIDNCINDNKIVIEKLKEYRQALIYEAVTGKIDVRELELD